MVVVTLQFVELHFTSQQWPESLTSLFQLTLKLFQIQQLRQVHSLQWGKTAYKAWMFCLFSLFVFFSKNYVKKRLEKKVFFIQPGSVKPATWLQFLSAAAGNSSSTVIKYARPAFLCRVYFQHCCTQKWDKGCNTVRWVQGGGLLIWTQNDYLQLCFLLHEIDLHAFVILLLLSSPPFFLFILSRSQQTAQTKEATPPSGALLQTLRLSTARWICMWIMVQ